MRFHAGDRVRALPCALTKGDIFSLRPGMTGTVIWTDNCDLLVEFDEWVGGHDGVDSQHPVGGKWGHCLYLGFTEVDLYDEPEQDTLVSDFDSVL